MILHRFGRYGDLSHHGVRYHPKADVMSFAEISSYYLLASKDVLDAEEVLNAGAGMLHPQGMSGDSPTYASTHNRTAQLLSCEEGHLGQMKVQSSPSESPRVAPCRILQQRLQLRFCGCMFGRSSVSLFITPSWNSASVIGTTGGNTVVGFQIV
jgi:hypothetical protein